MERAVFDRMAELDQHHWWFIARRRILKALIARVVRPPKKARILEVGCGLGLASLVLRQRDYFLPGPQALFGFLRQAGWLAA